MEAMTTTGRRSRRQALSDCRSGYHRYGKRRVIGGGIYRRVCLACGTITIDLTALDEPLAAALLAGSQGEGSHRAS